MSRISPDPYFHTMDGPLDAPYPSNADSILTAKPELVGLVFLIKEIDPLQAILELFKICLVSTQLKMSQHPYII